MSLNSDITVIGGGIMGLLTAREFNRAGATVTIIDKGEVGKESSWAGGGILLPLYPWRQAQAISQLVLESLSLYPCLVDELTENTGIDPERYPCGLIITQNPDINAAVEWCRDNHITYEVPANSRTENLTVQTENPLWLPDIANIRNPRLIKSLKQDLLQRGVTFLENYSITSINVNGNHIDSLETHAGKLPVNQLVMTTGAWSADFFKNLFPFLSTPTPVILPVKGQMLLFAAEPSTLQHIVLEGDKYLIPRKDGHILAGSTVEKDTFDKLTTIFAKDQISNFAVNLLPALAKFPIVQHWSGIRPGTANGIPYIDCHPEIRNLSINAGHYRNGLAMAPASAQLLVDLVLKQTPKIDPNPYRLVRVNSCIN